jgi:hypothetical protein
MYLKRSDEARDEGQELSNWTPQILGIRHTAQSTCLPDILGSNVLIEAGQKMRDSSNTCRRVTYTRTHTHTHTQTHTHTHRAAPTCPRCFGSITFTAPTAARASWARKAVKARRSLPPHVTTARMGTTAIAHTAGTLH